MEVSSPEHMSRIFSCVIDVDVDKIGSYGTITDLLDSNQNGKSYHIDDYMIASFGEKQVVRWVVMFAVSPNPISLPLAKKILDLNSTLVSYPDRQGFEGTFEYLMNSQDKPLDKLYKHTITNEFLGTMSDDLYHKAEELNEKTLFSNPMVEATTISLWPYTNPLQWQLDLMGAMRNWIETGSGTPKQHILILANPGVNVNDTLRTLIKSINVHQETHVEQTIAIENKFLEYFCARDAAILVVDDSIPSSLTPDKLAAVNDIIFKRQVYSDNMLHDWYGLLILVLYDTHLAWDNKSGCNIEALHRREMTVIRAESSAVSLIEANATKMHTRGLKRKRLQI